MSSGFFLDCFAERELAAIIQKLSTFLRPGGKWLICDFQLPPAGWRRVRARAVLAMAFFRLATGIEAKRIVPPEPILKSFGLNPLKRAEFNLGLLYAEL